MSEDKIIDIEPGTNGEAIRHAMQVHYALKSPKLHIPGGVLGFLLLAATSALPFLPFAVAAGAGLHAGAKLRKNSKLVADGNTGKGFIEMFNRLNKDEKSVVEQFSQVYPPNLPMGERAKKKHQPLPPAATGESKTPATAVTKAEVVREGEIKKRNQEAPNSTTNLPENGSSAPGIGNRLADWQPEPLPLPFVEYLSKQIHILISATTGSGKTHLLRALCTQLTNQGHRLIICDPKGTQWGDLSPAALFMKTGIDYRSVLRDLDKELSARTERLQKGEDVGQHLWAVFDEWTLVKGKCQTLDGRERAALEQRLLNIIAAGRELNMHLIIINQSHLLGDLSLSGSKNTFSSGLRDNLCTLGLGCKTTFDHAGLPMQGNSKSIDSMLDDTRLIRDKEDRIAAASYHAGLRRQPKVNRTFCIYSSGLFIGPTPDLELQPVQRLDPFQKVQAKLNGEDADVWTA